MIKKVLSMYLKKKIISITTIRTYQSWYEFFLKKRREIEKKLPNYELHPKHIKNLKVLLNRRDLLKVLTKNAICAEVGVDKGDFSDLILMLTDPKRLHLIDAWGDPLRYHNGLKSLVEDKFKNEIERGNVEINVGYSTEILKKFPNRYFDWVYLDTSHTYKATAAELSILKEKVKPEGIIAGHDYIIGNWANDYRYGVIEAVHELCLNDNWELVYITANFSEMPSFAIRRILADKTD
jgi:hypothetical protein